jgi:hypothetical protein
MQWLRYLLLALACVGVGVVPFATASATGATPFELRITDAQTLRIANVAFSKVDGCVQTGIAQTATTGHWAEVVNGGVVKHGVDMTAAISVYNFCDGVGIRFLACSTSSSTVKIDQRLTSATLAGVLTCTDSATNETCQLTKVETLTGVGDLQTGDHHFQLREAGLIINFGGRGLYRSATVTSASVSGCGVEFDEQDAAWAEMGSSTGSSLLIMRS